MLDGILKLFKKGDENKIVGIDIGSSSIKLVQLSRKKGIAVLDTFGEISLSVYGGKEIGRPVILPVDKLAEALKDLMKEAQVDTRNAAFAISLKSTLMFNLKIPKTVDQSKLGEVVELEARKYIPVSIAEVQLDWSVLPPVLGSEKEEENYEILVVAIHKETLNKYANIASILDLNLKFLEVETFSTIRAILAHERTTAAIVDIGSSITKFYIAESGIIRKSHIINIGSAKILDDFMHKAQSQAVGNKNLNITGESARLFRESLKGLTDIPVDLSRIIDATNKAILDYQKKIQ